MAEYKSDEFIALPGLRWAQEVVIITALVYLAEHIEQDSIVGSRIELPGSHEPELFLQLLVGVHKKMFWSTNVVPFPAPGKYINIQQHFESLKFVIFIT